MRTRTDGSLKRLLAGIALALCGAMGVQGQISPTSYQGKLTDAVGNPVNTDVSMVFRFYNDSVGQSPSAVITQSVVQVRNGLFNVILNIPVSYLLNTTFHWMGVQVGDDAEMTPRIRMNRAPLAYSAVRAQTADALVDPEWLTAGGDIYRAFGHVGIGTSIPGAVLHVHRASGPVKTLVKSANNDADIIIDSAGAAGNLPTVEFHRNGIFQGSIGFDSTRTNIFIYHNQSVVFKDGRVGIGTQTPTNSLEVHGSIRVTGQAQGTFPRPDYDSGWRVVTTAGGDGVLSLTHNLGGNADNYVVDLMSRDPNSGYGVNNHGIGAIWTRSDDINDHGYFYAGLTTTTIGIRRGDADVSSDEIRVRIWRYQ